MLLGDLGNKVLTATWTKFFSTPTFNFCLLHYRGSQTKPRRRRSSKQGAGEQLGYEAASSKEALAGPPPKTRLSTRLLAKV